MRLAEVLKIVLSFYRFMHSLEKDIVFEKDRYIHSYCARVISKERRLLVPIVGNSALKTGIFFVMLCTRECVVRSKTNKITEYMHDGMYS